MFKNSELLIVENKIDIQRTDSPFLHVSCTTGEGIDLLVNEVFHVLDKKEKEINNMDNAFKGI